MPNQVLAQGTYVSFGGTPVPNVISIDWGQDTDQLEVTNHDSLNGTREYIGGLKTPTEVPMTVHYDGASHAFLTSIQGDATQSDTLAITTPDGSTDTMEAWVKNVQKHAPSTGEALTADLSFQITGPVTFGSS